MQEVVMSILPVIKDKKESQTLVSVTINCMRLDAAIGGFIGLIENKLLVEDQYKLSTLLVVNEANAISPILSRYALELRSRISVLQFSIEKILSNMLIYRSSIQQYGDHNLSVAKELSENGIIDLARQKKQIGLKELQICGYITELISKSTTSLGPNTSLMSSTLLPSCYSSEEMPSSTGLT